MNKYVQYASTRRHAPFRRRRGRLRETHRAGFAWRYAGAPDSTPGCGEQIKDMEAYTKPYERYETVHAFNSRQAHRLEALECDEALRAQIHGFERATDVFEEVRVLHPREQYLDECFNRGLDRTYATTFIAFACQI
ncbi:hypothetical protein FI667_g16243, partial [Globisporangium splendens]